MKNEEEKNQLLVELCYNYHFHSSDSLILDHLRYQKIFKKIHSIERYQKKSCWLTLKGSKKQKENGLLTINQ